MPIIVERKVYDGTRRHDYAEFEDDVCETVQSHYGTGGGNTPIVVEMSRESTEEDLTDGCGPVPCIDRAKRGDD